MYKHNKHLVPLAKELRKEATKEEKRLWYDFLSTYKVRFVRQKVLVGYIADFYCPKAKLVIELDGSQHYTEKGLIHDKERSDFLLQELGIRVIRISNLDVLQRFNDICRFIDFEVTKSLENNPSVSKADSSL